MSAQSAPAPSLDLAGIYELSDEDLAALGRAVSDERRDRAIAENDPEVLVREAFSSLHAGPEPVGPVLLTPGVLALASAITETSSGRHTCKLYTVISPGSGYETWAWNQETASYLHGDSEVVGRNRRGVDLHVATDDLVVVRHTMSKKGVGEPHVRLAVSATRVVATGGVEGTPPFALVPVANFTPLHLPPPEGEEDSRGASASRRR